MTIHMKDVSKRYTLPKGKELLVLEGIDLEIRHGDFVIILGQSGCGKSTLLNLLAGFQFPSTGNILINNKPICGPDPSIAFLFQRPSLLPWLTVEENVAFGCKIRGDTHKLAYRVTQFIEMVGLSGFEKVHPPKLSVGMAYRVSLARALIGHPQIFLLDEPLVSLDTFMRNRLQEELINIWLSEYFTAIFVTHDIDEAVLLGTKVVVLGGRPSRIRGIFDIQLPYPRKPTDESFFHTRTSLLKELKASFIENHFI
ncbi:MAG: ABC transporter ATP-binding protein [Desulfobacterales bacterium]|nr:ABC transporter ATP-binding protein [Desulfobacterales bacterium]